MARRDEFTNMELKVLRVASKGRSYKMIGEELGISPETVKSHIAHLLEKTGCENKAELALMAARMNLIVTDL